jgi:hypothetical protein
MSRRNPTTLRQGDNVHRAVGDLYSYGRHYPHKPPHDYEVPERTPRPGAPQPGFDEYRATYRQAKNSPVTPAPDESQPQFACEKASDLNDASGWVRGKGSEAPHPKFDSGPSGHRYRK